MVERAEMEQLLSLGVLDVRDPAVRLKVLEAYGKASFIEALAADTKRAIMEHEQFEALAAGPMASQILPLIVTELAAFQQAQQPPSPAPPTVRQGMAGPEIVPAPPPPPPPTYNELVGRLAEARESGCLVGLVGRERATG